MKKEYLYIGLAILVVGGLYWWNNNNASPASKMGTDEEKAFSQAMMERYKIGGRPSDGDNVVTSFGTYTYTKTKAGSYPAYISEGYWTLSGVGRI